MIIKNQHPSLKQTFLRVLIYAYSIIITWTGQLSRASSAVFRRFWNRVRANIRAPVTPIQNTFGQVYAHSPQGIQRSLSIVALICGIPLLIRRS